MKLGLELEEKGTGSGILLFSILLSVSLFAQQSRLLCHPLAYCTQGKKLKPTRVGCGWPQSNAEPVS